MDVFVGKIVYMYIYVCVLIYLYRYSDSIDGDFVITPHPDYKNLVVAAGDSGHGMK